MHHTFPTKKYTHIQQPKYYFMSIRTNSADYVPIGLSSFRWDGEVNPIE
jgi:hypothetical protein